MKINKAIQEFVDSAIASGYVSKEDRYYLLNRVLYLVGEESFESSKEVEQPSLLDAMANLVESAVESGKIENDSEERDWLEQELMNLVIPKPSELNRLFWDKYEEGPKVATDAFYKIALDLNLIKVNDIAKNISFNGATEYGDLEITINLSKPEKTKEEIIKAAQSKDFNYPANRLCFENVGYHGRINWPGRANHRIVGMELGGESWGYHYSPYAYYSEHAIFLSEILEPMKVDEGAFSRLLEIVTQFPHYFVGSNAGLPIVGGSILSHNHYQGGRYVFPMNRAKVLETGISKKFDTVEIERLYWPLSALRLRGNNREEVFEVAVDILKAWENYENKDFEILRESNGEPHNAITPIVRRQGDAYEFDLVLRNNRTTEEFPDGIFHPHADVQHIKKENIGLIEVMGLAILPPRLERELREVRDYLVGEGSLEAVAEIHQEWAKELKAQAPIKETVDAFLQKAVSAKFCRVLEYAGVFKQTKEGQEAFSAFMHEFTK